MLYYYVNETLSQCILESNIDIPINITSSAIIIDDDFVLTDADIKDNKFLFFNTDTFEKYLLTEYVVNHPTILHFYYRPYLKAPLVLLTSQFNEIDETDQEAIIGSGTLSEIDSGFIGIAISVTDTNGSSTLINEFVTAGIYNFTKLTSKYAVYADDMEEYFNPETPISIIHLETGTEAYNPTTKEIDLSKSGTYGLILGSLDSSNDVKLTDSLIASAHYKEIFFVI